jgi:hypothetical protein
LGKKTEITRHLDDPSQKDRRYVEKRNEGNHTTNIKVAHSFLVTTFGEEF